MWLQGEVPPALCWKASNCSSGIKSVVEKSGSLKFMDKWIFLWGTIANFQMQRAIFAVLFTFELVHTNFSNTVYRVSYSIFVKVPHFFLIVWTKERIYRGESIRLRHLPSLFLWEDQRDKLTTNIVIDEYIGKLMEGHRRHIRQVLKRGSSLEQRKDHFWQHLRERKFHINQISSKLRQADIMTWPLPRPQFESFWAVLLKF